MEAWVPFQSYSIYPIVSAVTVGRKWCSRDDGWWILSTRFFMQRTSCLLFCQKHPVISSASEQTWWANLRRNLIWAMWYWMPVLTCIFSWFISGISDQWWKTRENYVVSFGRKNGCKVCQWKQNWSRSRYNIQWQYFPLIDSRISVWLLIVTCFLSFRNVLASRTK